ncbi:folate family ECF transporter S component [Limosilactobacillus gastricus]|uniref:folate family ECF transporter S component n=1 Tax=Limosilactobacillus gastricus TaxID=227942 RepID=UPI0002E5E810|nr:folate family ECF transporter S component [Limosilactobacillus gastricus]
MHLLSWRGPKITARVITISALFLALKIVVGFIPAIGSAQLVQIGLGFLVTAPMGYYLGPWLSGIILVFDDIISNTIFNFGGSMFFPGYTFSSLISGIIAGAFLYQQKPTLKRIFTYMFVQILISNVILGTLWLVMMGVSSILTPVPFAIRMLKEVVTWPIEAIVVYYLLNSLLKARLERYIYQ